MCSGVSRSGRRALQAMAHNRSRLAVKAGATGAGDRPCLQSAVDRAIAQGGPHLIEVSICQMASPWPMLGLRGGADDGRAPAVRGET